MNCSYIAKKNKSNVIYGKIYGSVPCQIKSKLRCTPDLLKVKNGRELFKQNKDLNIL